MATSSIFACVKSTKKLTRIEPQSTLRRLLMRPSFCWPPMSKRSMSPSFRPSSSASPSSTDRPPASSGSHLPLTISLCAGGVALWLRLNSRSTRRLARSPLKLAALTDVPLMATRRPRIIGYQS